MRGSHNKLLVGLYLKQTHIITDIDEPFFFFLVFRVFKSSIFLLLWVLQSRPDAHALA